MTRIRLYVEQSLRTPPAKALDSSGAVITVPFLRVFVFLRVGSSGAPIQDAIIDPGAPVTVVPLELWEPVADQIEWLESLPVGSANWLTEVSGKGGGSLGCRPGRITMIALDVERPSTKLDPVSVFALFEQEKSDDDRILVGLHQSILQGRRFYLNVDERDAWIEQP